MLLAVPGMILLLEITPLLKKIPRLGEIVIVVVEVMMNVLLAVHPAMTGIVMNADIRMSIWDGWERSMAEIFANSIRKTI